MQKSTFIRNIAIRRIALFSFMFILCSQMNFAQSDTIVSTTKKPAKNGWQKITSFINSVDRFFSSHDTLYVTPNKYIFKVTALYTNRHEFYDFASDNGQSITMVPANRSKFGLAIAWKWLSVGYSFDFNKYNKGTDFNMTMCNSRCAMDVYYRKKNTRFRISDYDGFYNDNNEIQANRVPFEGLSVSQIGANLSYIFNNQHFSYRAAYIFSTVQRISSGGFILGLNYNHQRFRLDSNKFDEKIKEQLANELNFGEIKYNNIALSCGYSYNWVFARNFMANITITPAIGYKSPSLCVDKSVRFIDNINFDLTSRLAVVYNNTHWYAGASAVSNFYSYRKDNLSVVNEFGIVKAYIGIYFVPRKKR